MSERAPAGGAFVLVPGSHHGGWCFAQQTRELRARGHAVHPVTLTGVSERHHLGAASVNLDRHIDDVIAVLDAEQIPDAILCGHSYGGMVIAGVADRVPDRVAALAYLDAFVPQDGDSVWDITTDAERRRYLDGSRGDGFSVPPMPFFDARASPHPLACFLQALRLTGAGDAVVHRFYVHATGWEDSPFGPVAERLRNDPAWRFHALDSGHNLMRDAPAELLAILLDAQAATR